jgi:nucleobase:cation symporter-1, NCS1 family
MPPGGRPAGPGTSGTAAFQALAFTGMRHRFRPGSVTIRFIPCLCVTATGMVIACRGYQHFATNLTSFPDALQAIFLPWSTVNLADYFIVRHGHHDAASCFTADGTHGRLARRGPPAHATGPAARWPFMSQPGYTGPPVKTHSGAGISWPAGWLTAPSPACSWSPLLPATRHDRPITCHARARRTT